jgi:3-keto-5-aminohexanoate cleavage enzyme
MLEAKNDILDFSSPYSYTKRIEGGISKLPPLIISVAITGGTHGKELNPNLPETPEEQAEQTYEAYKAGASQVHIHRRRGDNPCANSYNPEEYKEVNALIREKCPNIIINNTTGGGPGMTIEQRLASLHAYPEVASLDLTCIPFRAIQKARKPPLTGRTEDTLVDAVALITFGDSERFAMRMREMGVKPEIELYDVGDFGYVRNLMEKKLLDPPYWIQIVIGFRAGIFPIPQSLLAMLQYVPPNSQVSVVGVGIAQIPMITMAIILGCHVRVGLEDNIYIERGKLAESNAQQVEKVVRLAKELSREVATPKVARQMIGISEEPRQYK